MKKIICSLPILYLLNYVSFSQVSSKITDEYKDWCSTDGQKFAASLTMNQSGSNTYQFSSFFDDQVETGKSPQDSIKLIKRRYYYQEQLLTNRTFKELIKNNERAYKKYQGAKTLRFFSSILAYTGGYFIGYPIGQSIGGGDPDWKLAGIGAGIIVVAFPMAFASDKQVRDAVDIYNGGIGSTSNINKELKIEFAGNSIKLCLRF